VDNKWMYRISGMAAGLASGLFGGGGGMVLVPLLQKWCHLEPKRAFASCVAVILPFCVLSASISLVAGADAFPEAIPYILGGFAGGFLGGRLFRHVSTTWLRRIFIGFLLYGGVRYLL